MELEGQGCGIIMGVTRLVLLGPFYYIGSQPYTDFRTMFCERGWWSIDADCNASIVLWGRNFKPYKKFLLYFIFINLSAQEVRICSEFCFNTKWKKFSYEFSTFIDLFAKNNLQKKWRQGSNAVIFLSFYQFFSNFFKVSG